MEPRPHERGKDSDLTAIAALSPSLQWSHVLTNVERVCCCNRKERRNSFNGATSSRTWKGQSPSSACRIQPASMEPRPHERGKLRQVRGFHLCKVMLQWSHVLTNVERTGCEAGKGENMELQWSHVLTNVESARWPLPLRRRLALQWSHVLTNVESSHECANLTAPQLASMEPRPHERGKNDPSNQSQVRHNRFNGATSSRTWKDATNRSHYNFRNASMEPRPHERGKEAIFSILDSP